MHISFSVTNESFQNYLFLKFQAGGASTQTTLNAAMSSIQEALKNSDWRTRKAACEALLELASTSTNGSFSDSIKSSCIRSLELCRFDKVHVILQLIF